MKTDLTTGKPSLELRFASILALSVITAPATAATYQVIDPPPGYLYVSPNAVSPDGTTVALSLESDTGTQVRHLWTPSGGLQPILLSGHPQSANSSVSDDFSVLVGTAFGGSLPSTAFVWTSADGTRAIDPLAGDTSTRVDRFSADGSTVMGKSIQFAPTYVERDFVWTAETGTQEIAAPAPGCNIAAFMSISNDGGSAVGYGSCGTVYWTATTGAQLLPSQAFLPGAPNPLLANLISADGSKATFLSIAFGIWRIGLWTVGGNSVELVPPPAESSLQFTPQLLSADGSTVVLQSNDANGHHVFRWKADIGSHSLTVPGFFSTHVAGNRMSADGSTVILNAINDCAISCIQTAFVWTAGSGFQEIPPASQESSTANYVSADGAMVSGNFFDGGTGDRGFVWSATAGVEVLEPVPGDDHSFVQTVSANGTTVVGGSCTTDYALCRGVVWSLSPPAQNQVPTPTGDDVTVEPVVTQPGGGVALPVQLTFDSVTSAGTTTVTASTDPSAGAPPSPPQFSVGDPPVYYDVDTTANFAGPIVLCFSWQEGQFDNEGGIVLFHFEAGAWQNVTTSVDINNNKVCGQVNSLSPFALFERTYAFSGFFQPIDNQPTLNTVKGGSAIPVKFSLSGDQGMTVFAAGYPKSQKISCSTSAPLDAVEETVTAGASSLSYAAAADRYHYVWKTDTAWAGTCRQLNLRLNDSTDHVANFKFK